MKSRLIFINLLFLSFFVYSQANGFVHSSGTRILDIDGENLILRGIGTGNWMLQEGYMMGTSGATNGTQWHFRQKLTSTIGLERTNEFYKAWLDNHFSKIDIDSMAVWGFNSIRPALHYNLFTLPIEEEPEAGKDTWLEDGFARLDSLIKWCGQNRMYVILDMHGCPGAQGSDSNISDYDSSKPSLWESEQNKRKLVALWRKIAERYAESPWIGGYDLINEPKWDALKTNGNKDLWDLFKRMVDAIREVDRNHLIFLAGNSWGNDYSGLPNISTWGGNIALSFHKYWSYNLDTSLDWIINLGKQHNVPVWLGETGENSNTWFADLVRVCESKNVGWSWWPVKKMGINNILRSKGNSNYTQMLNAWRNNTSIDANTAYNGVMQFAENHKFENCVIQYDVIDALIKRPLTNETRPFKNHQIGLEIFASDYDLGPVGYAYFDTGDADYHGSGESYTNWNQGWVYRNDGVDIQSCIDQVNNGFSVGWIDDGEWLNYTITSTESKAYSIFFRYASQPGAGRVYVEVNGKRASKTINLQSTGAWTTWNTAVIPNVIVPEGNIKLKIVFEKGNFNFNYFKLTTPKAVEDVNFELLSAESDKMKNEIVLAFNQPVDDVFNSSFVVKIGDKKADILSVRKDPTNNQCAILTVGESILNNSIITIDNTDETCTSGNKSLVRFVNFNVTNKTVQHFNIPAKVEAEDYGLNNKFVFQVCEDEGGGENAGYTASGNYLDYIIYADYTAEYALDLRVAVNSSTARLAFYDIAEKNTQIGTASILNTGGWQKWKTYSSTVNFKKGKNIFRIYAVTDGFNFNWFELKEIPGMGVENPMNNSYPIIFPNPVDKYLTVQLPESQRVSLLIYDVMGKLLSSEVAADQNVVVLDMSNFMNGMYLLKMKTSFSEVSKKIFINRP